MKSRKGFTLVELMVVILIVAILAAVAIPILRGRIESAKWAEGRSMMGSIATSIRAFAAEKGIDYGGALLSGTLPSTDLGFAAGDCDGTYFVDGEFSYSVTAWPTSTGASVAFIVSCTPAARFTPMSVTTYTLTGEATGETTWNP